jgi:hypothetical protein
MDRIYTRAIFPCSLFALLVVSMAAFAASRPPAVRPVPTYEALSRWTSSNTLALAASGLNVYAFAADEDAHMVRVFDVTENKQSAEQEPIALAGSPGQVVVHHGSLFVSLPLDNQVIEYELPSRRVLRTYATCTEPRGLLAHAESARLYVLCGFGHRLQAFAHDDGRRVVDVDLPREPRAMAAFGEGAQAVIGIAHAVGSHMSIVSVSTARSAQRPLGRVQFELSRHPSWADVISAAFSEGCQPDVHELNQGFAIAVIGSARGASWVLPTVDVVPMPQPEQGLGEAKLADAPVFAGYGTLSDRSCGRSTGPVAQVRLALVQKTAAEDEALALHGCTVPRAIAIDRTTGDVAVSCVNGDRIAIVNDDGQRDVVAPSGSFGLAYDDRGRLVTWSTYEGLLAVADRGGVHAPQLVRARNRVHLPEPVAIGRELFHSDAGGRVSSDGRACASCHPDGRDDGLVWGAPNGPRQTPTLMGRVAGTAPYGWNGGPSRIAAHMEETIRRLGGTGLIVEDREAIEAYVMSMRAPALPTDERPIAAEGAKVFAAQGCAGCHDPSSAFTDGATHEFALPSSPRERPQEKLASFDTPSLRLVGSTAPYFHDGRYPTLRALLADRKNPMADMSELSNRDIDALEAYLGTL